MQKKWFKTKKNAIIDLNIFDSFHIENTPWNGTKNTFTAFASIKGGQDALAMAVFQSEEESSRYIDEIYEFLGKNETI